MVGGKKAEEGGVIPEIGFEHGQWKFVNFRYKVVPAADLLTILRSLRAARLKN